MAKKQPLLFLSAAFLCFSHPIFNENKTTADIYGKGLEEGWQTIKICHHIPHKYWRCSDLNHLVSLMEII